MRIKIAVSAFVLIMSTACGVEDSVEWEATNSKEQAVFWECTEGGAWLRYWRVNGVEVGRDHCDCYGFLTEQGQHSGSYSQFLEPSCSGGGGSGGGGGGCNIMPPGEASTSSVPPEC